MKLGNKILLLMLLITIGTSALLAWVVTLNVTKYETRRARERIAAAIDRYVTRLEDRHRQVRTIVQNLVEAPASRSQLQAVESGDDGAREQLRQEVLGRTVHSEIANTQGIPAFHVLLNQAGEVLLTVAPQHRELEPIVSARDVHWPVEAIISAPNELFSIYVFTPAGLFLAMGVPLRTQLDEAPTHAYFVGFRVDDEWVRQQLLAERSLQSSSDAPLTAWFSVDHKIVARASTDPADQRVDAFSGQLPVTSNALAPHPASRALIGSETVMFPNSGEQYLGQSFDLRTTDASVGQLILASSLDQALQQLHGLQRQIAWCALVACAVAIFACRWLAWRIAHPIQELLDGTQRIAQGNFDHPLRVKRRDEFGRLGHAFNHMSRGLKERDTLRDERVKIERDLALARKIQQDVLPKHIPPCPGYDLVAYSLPAEQTGGDIYDLVAVALDDDDSPGTPPSMILLLADATGHGVGPALSVTQVRAMLRIGVRLRAELDDVFRQINRQLCQDLGAERFVTAFLGLLDPSSHQVNYQSAGQAPLLHFRAADKSLCWLDSSTIPFGIEENPDGQGQQRIALEPGDLFVLLTDGFYEFQNTAGDLFSADRVGEVVIAHHHRPSKEILDELLEAINAFGIGARQHDDMTALIIKRLPSN